MNKSPSLRRILSLVITSVLLSALVTLSVYSFLSPQIFAQAKLDELYPRAVFLAEQASSSFGFADVQASSKYLFADSRQWDATVYLLDRDRNVINYTENPIAGPTDSASVHNFGVLIDRVMGGQEVTRISEMVTHKASAASVVNLLFIGIPVRLKGELVGAVVMLKPLQEVVSAMSTLSSTLWFSALAVLCAMLPMVYWFSRRITLPIHQMRDVALRMAAGDFTIRADDREMGESGDLARALNHLAGELGKTIADLTRERNQAVTIVNALGEGVLAVDAQCRPVRVNPSLQSLCMAAGNGKPLPLPPEVWEDFHTALSEGRCTDRRFLFGDLLVHLTVAPIGGGREDIAGAVGVFREETEAYRLEQTRRDYVANVSHELKTPLTALRALIEPLRDGLIHTEEKRAETYDIILRETMRLSRLVDDMLELSRLQSGRLALEKIRFHVEPLLHDTASIFAAKAATTGHVLALHIISPPLPTVLGNPDRTEQVLVALLNNAFTYTPKGSTIQIRAEAFEKCLHITVEDDGPGIAPADLAHVFERFYKADKAHGTGGGTGLGLAIARELMHRLGEEITAENREGGGARFMFTLHYA